MSGEEWRALTTEQKQPYIDRAHQDKQRVTQERLAQQLIPASSEAHSDEKQSGMDTAAACAMEADGQAEERSVNDERKEEDINAIRAGERAVEDERKEAMDKVVAVEEEFSELSPAVSARRPSDPSVQPASLATESPRGRRAVAVSAAPVQAARPNSAMQMYINDRVGRWMKEARNKGAKVLKGDAKKAARQQWDHTTEAEKDVSHTNLNHTASHTSTRCHRWLCTLMRVTAVVICRAWLCCGRCGEGCVKARWRSGSGALRFRSWHRGRHALPRYNSTQ